MKNDGSRNEGGLVALDKLYISINTNSAHWSFIRVAIKNKTIQLFDSQGVNAKNNKYLQAIENFTYDALTKNLRGERQDYNVWK